MRWRSVVVVFALMLGTAQLATRANSAVTPVPGIPQGASRESSPASTATLTPDVRLRRGSAGLPDGCTPADVADLVTGFLNAFNRGDTAALAAFFPAEAAQRGVAEPGKFNWFSAPAPGGGISAYTRDDLLPQLAARHEQHERMHLLRLEAATSWHPGVDIVYDIAREADDLPPHVAGGKGAVMCGDRTIFVWSMGDTAVLQQAFTGNATPESD